jgi:hypothetical protein
MLRDYPWVLVRVRCHFCERGGDARLAVLAAKYGPYISMGRLIVELMKACSWAPWNPARRPQKYGMKCGLYCLDLRRADPPDHPPGMRELNLIEGGKGNMLPAEPVAPTRRRRVGEFE